MKITAIKLNFITSFDDPIKRPIVSNSALEMKWLKLPLKWLFFFRPIQFDGLAGVYMNTNKFEKIL